jgi:hypothetical protein
VTLALDGRLPCRLVVMLLVCATVTHKTGIQVTSALRLDFRPGKIMQVRPYSNLLSIRYCRCKGSGGSGICRSCRCCRCVSLSHEPQTCKVEAEVTRLQPRQELCRCSCSISVQSRGQAEVQTSRAMCWQGDNVAATSAEQARRCFTQSSNRTWWPQHRCPASSLMSKSTM